MSKSKLDREIELLVNFYAKPGEKEMLEAAVRTLVERVQQKQTVLSVEPPEINIEFEKPIHGINFGGVYLDEAASLTVPVFP